VNRLAWSPLSETEGFDNCRRVIPVCSASQKTPGAGTCLNVGTTGSPNGMAEFVAAQAVPDIFHWDCVFIVDGTSPIGGLPDLRGSFCNWAVAFVQLEEPRAIPKYEDERSN